MKPRKLPTISNDAAMIKLVSKLDKKQAALWAADCAKRVLPYFEKKHTKDDRPRKAIEAALAWRRGEIKIGEARKAAWAAHAAARSTDDAPACAAARSAGHAAATAHVASHSNAAATYAVKARVASANPTKADIVAAKERAWQYKRLLKIKKAH